MEEETKLCPSCNLQKLLSEFKFKRKKCYPCFLKQGSEWKARNKQKVADYNKIYKAENREIISEYNAQYNLDNRAEIQKRSTANHNRLLREDPNFKMAKNLRARIREALKGNPKVDHTLILLGCSLDFFRAWFTYCFTEDMNFDNHGEIWHIDHTIPCSKFNLINEEQQRQCFHWTNMKPMYAKENLKKNCNHTLEEVTLHQKNIKSFLAENSDTWKGQFTLIDYSKNYL